ncbi:MAG: RNA methyltransferase [Bacteroidia bacterium]|nr:RNA methyltransferase [Bacteroidia bacterium]
MQKKTMKELGRISASGALKAGRLRLVIVLDQVRSAMNVGSVFRTADAFSVQAVFLCGITSVPPDPEIHKTALGATESVYWEHFSSGSEAVIRLKKLGYRVFALEQVHGATDLCAFLPASDEKIAIVLGHEVNGVSGEVIRLCDGAIEIPQFGMKHSLNVAVSAGIVIWDLFVKMKK